MVVSVSEMESRPAPTEAPEGTRDLLFESARRVRACETALQAVFSEAGYDEVIPPSIEKAEIFDGVAAMRASDGAGRAIALRADFTAQIARIAATRLRDREVLRLWYRGPVVRDMPAGRMAPRERLQCGLELIGQPGVDADEETLGLVSAAIDALGFDRTEVRISVGSTAYFAAILAHADLSPRARMQLRDAIDRKDRAGTRMLTEAIDSARVRDALSFLASAEPQAAVLETADALAPDEAARTAVARLRSVVTSARRGPLGDILEVDLGEVRGLGYYTGLVFNVYVAGAPGPVGGGGRYDQLLGRFGDGRPAVGFSLDLDALAPLARCGGSS
jgi:ATP phosphoribosyltransferase regulatory subunit